MSLTDITARTDHARMSALDAARLRRHFPAVERMLYLDAAAQAPLALPVRAALDAFHDAALHTAGPKGPWLARVEEVRAKLGSLIGTSHSEVAFTKNASEGLNICAHGIAWEPGDNVLVAEGEHPNHAYAWLAQRSRGLEVRLVPAATGWLAADTFAPYLDGRTRAIALSHVAFHSGQRNDVAAISALARAHGAAVVVDATQSIGVLEIDAAALGATAIAAGGHKGLLAPHGVGFLHTAQADLVPTYVATAGVANVRPDLVAGPEPVELRADATRFEIGNFNLAGIHGLGAALDLLADAGIGRVERHVLSLGDQLIACADERGVDLVGPREQEHRSHIYVLRLTDPRWPGFFADEGVRVSTVRDGIRVSFGLFSTCDDVTRFAEVLRRGLRRA